MDYSSDAAARQLTGMAPENPLPPPTQPDLQPPQAPETDVDQAVPAWMTAKPEPGSFAAKLQAAAMTPEAMKSTAPFLHKVAAAAFSALHTGDNQDQDQDNALPPPQTKFQKAGNVVNRIGAAIGDADMGAPNAAVALAGTFRNRSERMKSEKKDLTEEQKNKALILETNARTASLNHQMNYMDQELRDKTADRLSKRFDETKADYDTVDHMSKPEFDAWKEKHPNWATEYTSGVTSWEPNMVDGKQQGFTPFYSVQSREPKTGASGKVTIDDATAKRLDEIEGLKIGAGTEMDTNKYRLLTSRMDADEALKEHNEGYMERAYTREEYEKVRPLLQDPAVRNAMMLTLPGAPPQAQLEERIDINNAWIASHQKAMQQLADIQAHPNVKQLHDQNVQQQTQGLQKQIKDRQDENNKLGQVLAYGFPGEKAQANYEAWQTKRDAFEEKQAEKAREDAEKERRDRETHDEKMFQYSVLRMNQLEKLDEKNKKKEEEDAVVDDMANSLRLGVIDPSQLPSRTDTKNKIVSRVTQQMWEAEGKPGSFEDWKKGDHQETLPDGQIVTIPNAFDAAAQSEKYAFAKAPGTNNAITYARQITAPGGDLDLLRSAARRIGKTNFPSINDAKAWAQFQTGNKDIVRFKDLAIGAQDALGKILSGSSGGAVTSDAARKQAGDLIDQSLGAGQTDTMADTVEAMVNNRLFGMAENNRYIQHNYPELSAMVQQRQAQQRQQTQQKQQQQQAPQAKTFAPGTHVFDSKAWAAANPGKDVNAAKVQAAQQGFEVK
jgi:hypothetical protein